MPYPDYHVKKKISEINPDVDLRVKLFGFVVDKKGDTIIMDDGSGKVRAFVDDPSSIEGFDVNQVVKVFGSVIPTEDGFEIKAEVIQNLSGLDINLYKKVEELYNSLGV